MLITEEYGLKMNTKQLINKNIQTLIAELENITHIKSH